MKENKYRNLPVIKTGCVISIQENIEGKKRRKVMRGDLRVDIALDRLIMTGIQLDRNGNLDCYVSDYDSIDIFPKEVTENPNDHYDGYGCVSLYPYGKISKSLHEVTNNVKVIAKYFTVIE